MQLSFLRVNGYRSGGASVAGHKGLLVFQPYIGKWVGDVTPEDAPDSRKKKKPSEIVLTFGWAKNGNAVVGNLRVKLNNGYVDFSQALYVWDPQRKTIVGLDSVMDGSMSHAEVTAKDGKFIFAVRG